ncbi:MAG: hypothetical protein HY694_14035 [Deltaproteobacteria bacterium]|nr:hypothetical protein [Deltaproteobacteria bacterium]
MAKKNPKRQPPTIGQRFTSLERLVRAGFRQVDTRFRQVDARFTQIDRRFTNIHLELRNLRKEMNERFAVVDDRIDRLANHVDGFVKLHETLDIELKVMKEQMNRFEERLKRLEAAQAS